MVYASFISVPIDSAPSSTLAPFRQRVPSRSLSKRGISAEMALIRMNFAAALRRDLAHRAQTYARREGLPHCLTRAALPSSALHLTSTTCGTETFLSRSYQAYAQRQSGRHDWQKVHTTSVAVPAPYRTGTMERTRYVREFRRLADEHFLPSRCVASGVGRILDRRRPRRVAVLWVQGPCSPRERQISSDGSESAIGGCASELARGRDSQKSSKIVCQGRSSGTVNC